MLEAVLENQFLLLLILAILIFIAFKIMQVVVGTVMAAALSAGAYSGFEYFIRNSTPSIEFALIFAASGASLYILYTLMTSTYSTAAKILYIPRKLLYIPGKIFKLILGKIRKPSNSEDEE